MSTPSEILAKWQEADKRLVDEYNDLGYMGVEARMELLNQRYMYTATTLALLLKHLAENESKDAA